MTKIKQLRRWDNLKVLFQGHYYTTRECIESAISHGIDLSYINLRGFDIRNCDLNGAIMRHADLRYANARGVKFANADLTSADFMGIKVHPHALSKIDSDKTDLNTLDTLMFARAS